VVIVDWKDLQLDQSTDALGPALEQAYGAPSSTGILVVRNVPGFVAAKRACLPAAHALAHLPAAYLEEKLTDPPSLYNAGWSHGKEKLGDKPDTAKGSFYYNPVTDLPGTPQDRATYPLSYPGNKWPDQETMPGFQDACKHLGCILKETAVLVARHIDALAASKLPVGAYEPVLFKAVQDTEKVKCRLLYYFPLPNETAADGTVAPPTQDGWIGWHNDSGFLTALAGDFYVDDETGAIIDCPDESAGLYVINRNNQVQRVVIPPDCMAIQMGECTQIITGGAVTATPHCVRGVSAGHAAAATTARISLPCFIDTPPGFALNMPAAATREQVLDAGGQTDKVPPLSARWAGDGMSFGDFLQKTFSMYYSWNTATSS
jgi:isopenicillin N synthase-like dioxygenase